MFTPINAAEIFNKVMAKHSLPVRAAATDFVFADKCVLLGMSFDGEKLANTLFDQLFPRSPAGIYHHYTSYGGFKGIVSSGSLRLYNLHKRFASGEFRTFCRDHGLDGYLRTDAGGNEEGYFADLMTDLFYTSLVNAKAADSDLHWERFADRHRGVRLTLRISLAPKYPNFRAVTYQQPDCVPAFKDLKAAFNREGLNFVNSGLCRMPGFYQRQDFSSQFDPAPPDGIAWFLVYDGYMGQVRYGRLKWTGGDPNFLESTWNPLTVPSFGTILPDAKQKSPGADIYLESQSTKLMMATARNIAGTTYVWTCHQVGMDYTGNLTSTIDRSACAWYRFKVIQSGSSYVLSDVPADKDRGKVFDTTQTPTPRFYYLPSLAVNSRGDMVMGFSASSVNEYIGAWYASRAVGDPPGTIKSPTLIHSGKSYFVNSQQPYKAIVGDYSFTSVDPSDNLTIWTIQEFGELPTQSPASDEIWGTFIGIVKQF